MEALVWAAVAATSPEEVRVAKAERGTARATAAMMGAAAAGLRKVALIPLLLDDETQPRLLRNIYRARSPAVAARKLP